MSRPPCDPCTMGQHCQQCGCCGPAPIRGRRPGAIPRGNCPDCGREHALRANGQPFRHQRVAANGYTRLGAYCPGGERRA